MTVQQLREKLNDVPDDFTVYFNDVESDNVYKVNTASDRPESKQLVLYGE